MSNEIFILCALAEIKQLNLHIQRIVDYGSFIDISKKNVDKEQFSESYKSLRDLIHCRNSLRRDVVKSDIGNENIDTRDRE